MNATEPTVHIVDDDAPFLEAVSRLLRASGFAVKTSGRRATFSRSGSRMRRAVCSPICECPA